MTKTANGTDMSPTTKKLLTAGFIAGPLFLIISLIQGVMRQGFDLSHQPISFLSVGDLGWIQVVNFVVTGLLVLAFAVGVRRVLRGKPGGTFGPIFLAGLGLGLVVAGLFPPDPGFGYPPGTADGTPVHMTYHSAMHGVGFTLSFVSFVLAALVFARKDAKQGQWGQVIYTLVSAVAALMLSMTPGNDTIAVRDLIAAALLWLWVAVQSVRLLKR
jgi:hypothetical membrane protein